MSNTWTDIHDNLLQVIKAHGAVDDVKTQGLIQDLQKAGTLDAWHQYGNGEFNLLFHCSVQGNEAMARALLGAGADPSARNGAGNSVLNLFGKREQLGMAEEAYKALKAAEKDGGGHLVKEFVNQQKQSGWTILMSCADSGSAKMVEWLLSKGADPNLAMESTGWTAMHAAAKKDHKEALEILLKAGGDKNLEARHREFGQNLKVEDVTSSEDILEVLGRY